MAAGGAAGRPNVLSFGHKSGTPGATPYRAIYGGSQIGAYQPGALAGVFRGPGTIDAIQFDSFGTATVGFQIVNYAAGAGPQVVSPVTTNVQWLSVQPYSGIGAGASFPAAKGSFQGGYLWPISEIINNGNGQYYYDDPANGTTIPALVELYAASQQFTVGQQVSFQNSFANGFTNIGAIGSFTQGASTIYMGQITTVHYTYYQPIGFDDEVRIYVSPLIPYALFPGQNPGGSPVTVSLAASVTID